MCLRSFLRPFAWGALLLALTLTSCTKEDPVAPCTEGTGAAKAVDLQYGEDVLPAEVSGSKNGGDQDGSGISDDGDDLTGSDRNRKKKTS